MYTASIPLDSTNDGNHMYMTSMPAVSSTAMPEAMTYTATGTSTQASHA